MQEIWVRLLGQEDPLEKKMATHSSILAWSIPCTEEPGGLQSSGSQESDKTKRLNHQLNNHQYGAWNAARTADGYSEPGREPTCCLAAKTSAQSWGQAAPALPAPAAHIPLTLADILSLSANFCYSRQFNLVDFSISFSSKNQARSEHLCLHLLIFITAFTT